MKSPPSLIRFDVVGVQEVNLAIERGLFYTRLVLPIMVGVAVLLFRENLTNWIGIMVVLVSVEVYNFAIIRPTMYRYPRFSHTIGILLDTVVLIIAAFLAVPDLAARNVTADFWLVYLLFIVGAAFHFGPLTGFAYTAFLSAFFAFITLAYFPPDSVTRENLPVRLIFFFAIGGLVYWLSAELNRRRAYLEQANKNLEQQNFDTILMLATVVEARDSYTGSHLRRIRFYCEAIYRAMGASTRDVRALGEASITHDVGKAYVPDSILKKPGPLTPEERTIMERHAPDGEKILGNRPSFKIHREIARHHHEKWNCTGYPDRLAGEAIPLSARIVAAADVYDALTSRRPYKEPWESERASAEIINGAGVHFDPQVVEAFKLCLTSGEIDQIRIAHAEPPSFTGPVEMIKSGT